VFDVEMGDYKAVPRSDPPASSSPAYQPFKDSSFEDAASTPPTNGNGHGNGMDDDGINKAVNERVASGLGCRQLGALLRLQMLHKRRNCGQTVCELITPLLLMFIIVVGWLFSLSRITVHCHMSCSSLHQSGDGSFGSLITNKLYRMYLIKSLQTIPHSCKKYWIPHSLIFVQLMVIIIILVVFHFPIPITNSVLNETMLDWYKYSSPSASAVLLPLVLISCYLFNG
jgi:hypothetical protein